MLERLRAMLIKEFIQVLRDPRMRFVVLVVPIVQTVIFGYAVNTDVRHVSTAVFDLDHSIQSRDLIDRFVRSTCFDLDVRVDSDAQVREVMDRGRVKVVLKFNRGFGDDLRRGRGGSVQMIVDGTDSNTAGIAINYATRIVGDYNADLRKDAVFRGAGRQGSLPTVELASRAWYNENLESRNFYVPAVITNIVFIITIMLSSLSVVREKEIGTIEQVIVTPIGKGEFILGKTIPFVLIGYIDVAVIAVVAKYIFVVPLRGSILLLLGSTALFLMSSLGIGLLISTVSRTQQQAMMTAFFIIFPCVLLSGFAFPIENMPEPVQWLTYLNPMRFFLFIVRCIFLKGVGLDILWPQLLMLLVLGGTILAAAILQFKKTLS